ncbi:MAG: hypothetical protein JKY09_03375 [Crocinitomicaceae bacterium]|nr:hypothetical protein [Crocinitomicaceae bacterium]
MAGIFSGIAASIYSEVYYWANAYMLDFSRVSSALQMFSISIFVSILATIGFWLCCKYLKSKGEITFNLLFVAGSFVSIVYPFAAILPLDLEFPEMFPGFAVPMHFFPALFWMTLKPIFIKS